MSASTCLQSKPTQPKNTIRKFKSLDYYVTAPLTFNSGQQTMGSEGLNSNPIVCQRSTGSESFTSTPVDHRVVPNPDERATGSIEEKINKLLRFGPVYGEDTEANYKVAKDSAWKHIIKGDGVESNCMRSIKVIENQIIECYDEKPKTGRVFREMMARDGCFFLQLVIHILGGVELLGYHDQHPYFGEKSDSSSWISDMFFIGNQIPYILIDALMKQPIFQGVINKGIKRGAWKRPSEQDVTKLALYMMVVEPQLHLKKTTNKGDESSEEPPSNVLQALHNLLLGSGDHTDPNYSEMKAFRDLEAGTEGRDITIPSAGELQKLGIRLRRGKTGITNIRLENRVYAAYLYLPPFTIDTHTEQVLISLANHELNLNEGERELTAYLRFMRDLTRTYKDFKILQGRGIIHIKEDKLKGTMVNMLDTLVARHNSNFTLNFRQIRRKIKDYGGPPWRLISFMLGVLAVVQTIFTVLSYCIPPRT